MHRGMLLRTLTSNRLFRWTAVVAWMNWSASCSAIIAIDIPEESICARCGGGSTWPPFMLLYGKYGKFRLFALSQNCS